MPPYLSEDFDEVKDFLFEYQNHMRDLVRCRDELIDHVQAGCKNKRLKRDLEKVQEAIELCGLYIEKFRRQYEKLILREKSNLTFEFSAN